MEILAHRGIWKDEAEKNTSGALISSLKSGFGIETDLRDRLEDLVVSHDPATSRNFTLRSFFQNYREYGSGNETLALNIKSDGIGASLRKMLQEFEIRKFFCFDMSVPETVRYAHEKIPFFTRQSEYEIEPVLYEPSRGVWMDSFKQDWIEAHHVLKHLDQGKAVALVSPELHKRDHHSFWEMIRKNQIHTHEQVFLCTDFPDEARSYFQ